MNLVVDASVGLKWVLPEEDSEFADALIVSGERLLMPDFWLNEATNALWVQVRGGRLSREQAELSLDRLRAIVPASPTFELNLHRRALDIGVAVDCSTYDALYAAFALEAAADHVIAADRPFLAALRRHPDPAVARLPLDLRDWASGRGATSPAGA